ncbi:MAG: hypothetical protein A3B99_01350 [Candidatus Yanofskybacteria bacterium RIFCSPHIGHO2_02_FULL_44_12b]|uniref:Capsule polysaccharide biosynthesis protein n=1 Tax=Candidatus Wildermuthbacteria bacterium RIFCSPLOWO2_01_FULL_48_16 TaxID=1802461 RepID=A0A1G2RL77_9BACT|nr:MAG: hypothetical protein A3B99_01350 [Candidatus Yanofskybacteria bacterium RIFCSPHIGHO2_02_FULL_44_12b]OHA63830.1 MAG: hypothetical protein A2842_01025 [Candidatus Wildermuthbacteria bacterium RIFCSPHIGHO2_01_FULL_48_25]OHA73586.1 MAG: hypothetical protein A3B24_00140 [Candidatus Wildermuthbacteria bacterium RIFCSPLOWO2_01_FULL_48_16]
MKFCFLINNANFLSEFLGNIAERALQNGDSCGVVFNSKVAEYEKKRFFPKEAAFISKVDWCIAHYDPTEKEFGDFSWRDFLPIFDRFRYYTFDYKKSVGAVSQLYQFFNWIVQTQKPDAFIGEPPAGLFGEIAYYFAKKHHIPFLGVAVSRIEGRLEIFDSEYTDSRFQKTFENLGASDLSTAEKELGSQWIKAFLSHEKVPSYVKVGKISFSQIELMSHYVKRMKEVGKIFFAYLRDRNKFQAYDYESEAIFHRAIFALFEAEKRQFRIWSQKRLFSFRRKDEVYFLYPLQVQPEASTLVCARYYYNQAQSIHNIAFSLPFPCKLYVKEHPASIGTKPASFYAGLRRIPNVVLISPKENVQNLVRASAGVITLSSTLGMESALAGKPTYALGDVSYEYHPWCARVKNFDELEEKIRFDIQHPKSLLGLDAMNLRFAVSYLRNTIQGNIFDPNTRDTNNYDAIFAYVRDRAISARTK